jgi:hypothetical protein
MYVVRLITQRSQVQILPLLPVVYQLICKPRARSPHLANCRDDLERGQRPADDQLREHVSVPVSPVMGSQGRGTLPDTAGTAARRRGRGEDKSSGLRPAGLRAGNVPGG